MIVQNSDVNKVFYSIVFYYLVFFVFIVISVLFFICFYKKYFGSDVF